jgi:hypothetical protein
MPDGFNPTIALGGCRQLKAVIGLLNEETQRTEEPAEDEADAVRSRMSRAGDRAVLSLSRRRLLECGTGPMDRRH